MFISVFSCNLVVKNSSKFTFQTASYYLCPLQGQRNMKKSGACPSPVSELKYISTPYEVAGPDMITLNGIPGCTSPARGMIQPDCLRTNRLAPGIAILEVSIRITSAAQRRCTDNITCYSCNLVINCDRMGVVCERRPGSLKTFFEPDSGFMPGSFC